MPRSCKIHIPIPLGMTVFTLGRLLVSLRCVCPQSSLSRVCALQVVFISGPVTSLPVGHECESEDLGWDKPCPWLCKGTGLAFLSRVAPRIASGSLPAYSHSPGPSLKMDFAHVTALPNWLDTSPPLPPSLLF